MNTIYLRNYLLVTIIFALLGCDNGPKNPEQIAFMGKIQSLGAEKDRLSMTALTGKDSSGRVAPADIDSQVEKTEQAILQLIKGSPPDVIQWNAKVNSVQRSGSEIIVHSSYGSQYYDLLIIDPQSVKIAEQFLENDKITFSGNLGPERSRTLFGALSTQEFSFHPTSVVSKYGEIKQSASAIIQKTQLIQAQSAKQEKQRQQQAQEEALKDNIIDLCKSTLRSNLKYPESASFSWFKRNIVKRSENRWTFSDVIEAKNDFGGALPTRFECDATVLDERIEVSVRLLDGAE